jgi:DNA-binding protein Fis
MDSSTHNNSEKTANNRLTEKPTAASIENVPGNDTGYNVKQPTGGNVKDTQPPAMSGFFVPATCPRDCNKLPGVARNRTPRSGNTCSVPSRTLNGSRQPYNCQHVKQSTEENAVKTATNHAIGAPAPTDKGFTPAPSMTLPVSLLEVISQAKQERATTGKANAYGVLLEVFHKAILPPFFIECGGNLSEIARLLGIHRESVRKYATLAGIDTSGAAAVGGVL